MRPARILIPVALAALLLVLPTSAVAQNAGEPEMMEDPVEAMEPEIEIAKPVEPAAGDDVAAQGDVMPQAHGVADAAVADDVQVVDSAAAVTPTYPVVSGTGQLPFTGLDSGLLVQLFLVGSVLLAGGVTALAWAGARTETA